jgi:hypothetical protein
MSPLLFTALSLHKLQELATLIKLASRRYLKSYIMLAGQAPPDLIHPCPTGRRMRERRRPLQEEQGGMS